MPRPKPPQRDVLKIQEADDASPYWINGEPIADLIDRVSTRPVAVDYLPMGLRASDNYITDDEERGRKGFEVPLFKCTCGDWGCASIRVSIFVEPDTVTWRYFSSSGGPIIGLGPFVFDRRQYEKVFWIERDREGLQQTAWHLGTMDEAWVEKTLLSQLEKLVAAIATGERPLPNGRRVIRPMPLREDLEAFRLTPRDVFDFETGEVGTLSFDWWDETGPDDWTVTARIFYGGELPRLELAEVKGHI